MPAATSTLPQTTQLSVPFDDMPRVPREFIEQMDAEVTTLAPVRTATIDKPGIKVISR